MGAYAVCVVRASSKRDFAFKLQHVLEPFPREVIVSINSGFDSIAWRSYCAVVVIQRTDDETDEQKEALNEF